MFFGYVQPLVAEYGLYAVFVIVMLESAGVPLPGETALVLASIYAGATGDLHIAQVIAVAAAGATDSGTKAGLEAVRAGAPRPQATKVSSAHNATVPMRGR